MHWQELLPDFTLRPSNVRLRFVASRLALNRGEVLPSFPTCDSALSLSRLHISHRSHLLLLLIEEALSPDIQRVRVAFVLRCWLARGDVSAKFAVGLTMRDS